MSSFEPWPLGNLIPYIRNRAHQDFKGSKILKCRKRNQAEIAVRHKAADSFAEVGCVLKSTQSTVPSPLGWQDPVPSGRVPLTVACFQLVLCRAPPRCVTALFYIQRLREAPGAREAGSPPCPLLAGLLFTGL